MSPSAASRAVPGRHAGRHALVTGAGTGIGRAIALRLAAEGARVSLIGRTRATLEETLGSVGDGTGAAYEADVRDARSMDRALAEASAAYGPVDIAIANAGIGGPNGPGFQAADEDDRFDELLATNLGGVYRTFRAALATVGEGDDRRRDLVAIASVLARIGVAGYTGYCASKAGVTGLVRSLAAELAPRSIQVNAIAPGWVDTAMAWEGIDGFAAALGKTREEAHDLAMQDVPLGRMGRPEDVAGLVSWLVSADGTGMTGQTIDVNGGAFMG